MPSKREYHANPRVKTADPTWGKGEAYDRHRIYFVKPASKFRKKIGARQVSKAFLKKHPRSVTFKYAYTSRLTGKRIPPDLRIPGKGKTAWTQQGLLESTADKKFKTVAGRQRWASKLFKTLNEYKKTHLPPKKSPDLDRYLSWLQQNQSDFYESLVDEGLAPGDPSYFRQTDFDLAYQEGEESEDAE